MELKSYGQNQINRSLSNLDIHFTKIKKHYVTKCTDLWKHSEFQCCNMRLARRKRLTCIVRKIDEFELSQLIVHYYYFLTFQRS